MPKTQSRANLAELSAAVCCEFEDNPIALAMLGTTEVFLCAAVLAHIFKMPRIHLSCKRQGIAK